MNIREIVKRRDILLLSVSETLARLFERQLFPARSPFKLCGLTNLCGIQICAILFSLARRNAEASKVSQEDAERDAGRSGLPSRTN